MSALGLIVHGLPKARCRLMRRIKRPLLIMTALIAVVFLTRSDGQRAVAHESFFSHRSHRQGSHDDPASTELGEAQRVPRQLTLAGPVAEAFTPFAHLVTAKRLDGELIIETSSLPDHPMMIGIRAWQQQVPLPQPFYGSNAWRLPLVPEQASHPLSVLEEPVRGAIALAVNGIPIFCALNNRGEDTYVLGELDDWGGHCGRGDDYHYHIAPVHLEAMVGRGNPIAYALDGYPILGLTEADGSSPKDLDPFNGHMNAEGHYHYHATKDFPYVNGGLRGKVELVGDQIKQPKDSPIRPGQDPLRGATITGFERTGNQFDVQYEIEGETRHLRYEVLDDERVTFEYENRSGDPTVMTYRRGQPGQAPRYSPLRITGLAVLGGGAVGILLLIFARIAGRRRRAKLL